MVFTGNRWEGNGKEMILKELEYLYYKIPQYKITDNLYIKHLTYKEIVEYGEEKYIKLLYSLCLTPDDFRSELYDAGINWYEVDEVSWFYSRLNTYTQEDLDIVFYLSIAHCNLYENVNTKEKVLYDSLGNVMLTENNIKLIREHLNSMIGYLYKDHKEIPANDRVKEILIKEDRSFKNIYKNLSIKDVIINLLAEKFHESNSDKIIEITEKSDYMLGLGFLKGEKYIIMQIANKIYEELIGLQEET